MSQVFGTPQPNSVETVKQRCGEFLVEQAYINGQFISTGKAFEVHDPSTDNVIANVTVCDADLTNQAIQHAKTAFKTWSKKTPKERGALVAKWGQLMIQNQAIQHAKTAFKTWSKK